MLLPRRPSAAGGDASSATASRRRSDGDVHVTPSVRRSFGAVSAGGADGACAGGAGGEGEGGVAELVLGRSTTSRDGASTAATTTVGVDRRIVVSPLPVAFTPRVLSVLDGSSCVAPPFGLPPDALLLLARAERAERPPLRATRRELLAPTEGASVSFSLGRSWSTALERAAVA
jgi:hypothetical protein